MSPQVLFLLVGILCVLNGIFSPPLLIFFSQTSKVLLGMWQPSPNMVFYLTSLGGATFTLVVSGVPAALYERIAKQQESSTTSLLIWLAGAVFLSWPALHVISQMG